tara:strand:+ start:1473 stop:2270 length:798 start_codon:yes stop_codon:yes gene_type:complete
MTQKIIFITYGDSKKYSVSKKHLIDLAEYSNFFDECLGFSNTDLEPQFRKKFNNILNQERGGGYYVWKIGIIQSVLNNLNRDDILVYCDSGSSFNFNAKKRFFEYIELINDSTFGNLRFESKKEHIENHWTTKEIFNYFNLDIYGDIGNSTQLLGGHLIFQNNDHTKNFFDIFTTALTKNPLLISDYYKTEQIQEFKENRHDQSIMSVITKKYGGVILENETFFKKNSTSQLNYPFLSVRHYGHGFKDRIKYNYLRYKKNTPIYF